MKAPDLFVGKQLFVGGFGIPVPALGLGPMRMNGSGYAKGPFYVGSPMTFPWAMASVMIGRSPNILPIPGALCYGINNPYSLAVAGNTALMGKVDTNSNITAGGNLQAQGHVFSNCGAHVLAAKKNFDIPHPTKEGYRLRHTCPEGPSNDVYFRGKLEGSNIIEIPEYWKELVDYDTITVNLTPYGSPNLGLHVSEITEDEIIVATDDLMSLLKGDIKCFYHVYGERKDGEKLIPEYEGDSPKDYPGNNDEYSVSGYHYDVRKEVKE